MSDAFLSFPKMVVISLYCLKKAVENRENKNSTCLILHLRNYKWFTFYVISDRAGMWISGTK